MKIRRVNLDIKSKYPVMQVVGEIEADVYDVDRIDFKAGDVVIDIGAHVGSFSCYVAESNPQVMIKAFEPVPETYEELFQNCVKYGNIQTFNVAVDVQKEVVIQHRPQYGYCSSSHYGHKVQDAEEILCPAVDLDSILSKFPSVKLLKMDCEGAEWDLLLQSNLLEKVEYLSLELHMLSQYEEKVRYLKEKLNSCFDIDKLSIHIVDKIKSEGISGVTI